MMILRPERREMAEERMRLTPPDHTPPAPKAIEALAEDRKPVRRQIARRPACQ
jgi:hypothetical protein